MTVRARMRSLVLTAALALAAPLGLVAVVAVDTATAPPAAAHGSVTNPPTRNYGCWDRWGDDFQNPTMAQRDPMCWQAWQHNTTAMWNWNGLFEEGLAGQYETLIPNGQVCSAGQTGDGRYNSLDVPGNWVAEGVPNSFTMTLTDQASHGADYLWIYVTRAGFDPTRESVGWDDLELLQKTGRYAPASSYSANISLPGRSGRAVLFTLWKASHADQVYFFCSDINIGGGDLTPPPGTPSPTPSSPSPSPTRPSASPTQASPSPTTPSASPTPSNPVTGACTAAVRVTNSWSGGYQGEVTVTAGSSAIKGWKVVVNGTTITQSWNSTLSGTSTLTNASWNGSLAAAGSTTAGFIANGPSTGLSATCTPV